MPQRTIGVFDSGVGGLTVLQAIRKHLPDEDLVYLGDTARVPYGTKSPETVLRYALQAAEFLCAHQVKMIVVACNTASSVALQILTHHFNIPVVGVIVPGAQEAVRISTSGRIGVIGTEGTVNSGAYQREISTLRDGVQVFTAACPLFVPLAEEGWANHEIARLAAHEYLLPLLRNNIDTLVLGCTHYPLLKDTLRQVLPAQVNMVDSATQTAITVRSLLRHHHTLCQEKPKRVGSCRFYVTDVPTRFVRVGSAFLGEELKEVERVTLPAISPDMMRFP
ncbi:MAG: glutamate racemase [Desulfuromonadaceae bacterium]|nr:glutamate racemase [Desulfuromonas sp.]MDY0184308.1 glutamate racemase [Desulfuromonadaceae bacterium]